VQHNTSAFRRRGICMCSFTKLISVATERPKSLKTFLFSASLVVAQLWLIVVLHTSSFAWSLSRPLSRDWMHTHLNPWLIVVLCCVSLYDLFLIQLNLLSKSSQRCSRRSDMTVVVRGGRITISARLTTAFIARVVSL
jgi:hypothetical protein